MTQMQPFPWEYAAEVSLPVTPDQACKAQEDLQLEPQRRPAHAFVTAGMPGAVLPGRWIVIAVMRHPAGQQFVTYQLVEIHGQHR